MTIIPPEIGNLTQLTTLNVNNNLLTIISPEIGKLIRLTELYLENNELINIPKEIGYLTELHSLNLNNNQLTFKKLPTNTSPDDVLKTITSLANF